MDKKKIKFEKYKPPSHEETSKRVIKKVGKRPQRPEDLSVGVWSDQAKKVLQERYLVKDDGGEPLETPEDMCWRVAWDIATAESLWGKRKKEILEIAKEFYRLMVTHEFLPNSPTLMNAGTNNGLQYSACFVLPVEDSLEGIFDAIKYQALIHQTGGGTGFSFSRLRPNGSIVKSSKGVASGPISFMRIFDSATNEIKQGGKRRGANMGILRVDHPDILKFIDCKNDGGITNFNISVAVTDEFMKAYKKDLDYDLINPLTGEKEGQLSAKEVFEKISNSAWATGDPGVIFIDRANKGSANPIPTMGPVEATNPCVTGDTLVSTDYGLIPISRLAKKTTNIKVLADSRMTNKLFVKSQKVVETGVKQVYRLKTKEGYELKLTKDHKMMTSEGWFEAGELVSGSKLFISNQKGGFGYEGSLEEGKVLGWLVGDGTMKATNAVLSFFGKEKEELVPDFTKMVYEIVDGKQMLKRDYSISALNIKGRDETRIQSVRLWRYALENGIEHKNKLKVPMRVLIGTEDMQKGFLQALFTADGHVFGTADKGISVRLTSIDETLLKDVQRLLLNFGIASKIYCNRRTQSKRFIPDGRGGKKEYTCKAYHDLVISKSNLLVFEKEIGFLVDYKNLKLHDLIGQLVKRGPYKESFLVTFDEIIREGKEKVYDLTEPETHSFIANGFVVHNCGEQPLYPYDACNLGSIFLTYFVKEDGGVKEVDWEKLKETVRLATRFLDNVIEVNPYPLDEIRKTVHAIRRIGLGVGGWADMLIDLGIPYDSEDALELGKKIMRTIQKESVKTSQELAKERGLFPLWHESIYKNQTPRRNSTVTTIAPTGSISIIANSSSGIEPIFAVAYQHIVKDKSLDRTLSFINTKFEQIAKEKGFWSDELREEVARTGMVADIDKVPKKIQEVFKTAHEIHHDWHIKMQAAFQENTENAVSKTINMHKNASQNQVKEAYILAWETGCKGVTVFRDGCKDMQVLNLGVENGEDVKKKNIETGPVRTRPLYTRGSTYRLDTPVGASYITINEDASGEPLEMFINVGKAGSDVAAMAEALGRTISISLRFRATSTPKERAKEIAHDLAGIGGRRSVGFGPNKILSLPDAVSAALSWHYGFNVNGFQKSLKSRLGDDEYAKHANGEKVDEVHLEKQKVLVEDKVVSKDQQNLFIQLDSKAPGDICPSCGASSFIYQEGCAKCFACGHSEC